MAPQDNGSIGKGDVLVGGPTDSQILTSISATSPVASPTSIAGTETRGPISPSSTPLAGGSNDPNAGGQNTASSPTSPTSPPVTGSKKPSSSNTVSPGAAAGIAIGTAIIGALLAALIFFILFRRYKKRNQHQNSYAQHVGAYPDAARQEKGQMNVVATATGIDRYLPQPAEDDAIKGEMSRLRIKIKDHVQSYYHTLPVKAASIDQSQLQELAAATGLSTARLVEMLCTSHSRMSALRLYIAWVVLSRCGTQRTNAPSFLPGEVVAFAGFLAGADNTNTGTAALGSKWKAISGELLQSRYGKQAAENANLEQSIRQAIIATDSVVAPFVNAAVDANSEKRLRNLEGIMRRAAQFAFLLFSQPSSWAFDFSSHQNRIVVFPGLQQTVNEEGYACHPAREFLEPEAV